MFIDAYSHIQYHSQKDERWWKMFRHSKLSMLCFQILNPHLSTVGSSLSFFCNPNALPGIQSKKSLWFLIDVPWDFIHCGNHHFTTGWWWLEPWNGLWLSRNSWEWNNHPNWRAHTFQRDWNHQPVILLACLSTLGYLFRSCFAIIVPKSGEFPKGELISPNLGTIITQTWGQQLPKLGDNN